MNTPHPDPSDPLIAALQRDAARMKEPPFDAALHHAAMRRIRAMEDKGTVPWRPALAWVATLAVFAICAGLWLSHTSQQTVAHRSAVSPLDFSAVLAATRAATAAADADLSPPLPAWMSPTASLLEPLRLSTPTSQQPL